LWQLFDHHFDEFEYRYDDLFPREYGFFRPVISHIVRKYLSDCRQSQCEWLLDILLEFHFQDHRPSTEDRPAQPNEKTFARPGQSLDVKPIILAWDDDEQSQVLISTQCLGQIVALGVAMQLRGGAFFPLCLSSFDRV